MAGAPPLTPVSITSTSFPGAPSDSPARLFCLRNGPIEVILTNEGASIYRILTPDERGEIDDIVCYSPLHEHFAGSLGYLGSTVGRYANRIVGARFTLQGTTYNLVANESNNISLHGGVCWHKHLWDVSVHEVTDVAAITFSRRSPSGEGGFPGNVEATVTYTLNANGELTIDFDASTDEPTVVNLTNHAYFNLNGADYQSLDEQWFIVHTDTRTATDAAALPTGAYAPVANTVFDLSHPTRISTLLNPLAKDLAGTQGFDQNYVFKQVNSAELVTMATVVSRRNGRVLQVASTQPGMQLYTGNFMGGTPGPVAGQAYQAHQAFCCEPQHFPDTPNQPNFPPCTVTPEQPYRERIVFRFGIQGTS
ncbi:MAG: galactose mutarotase [Natronospirillum sp.]